MMRELLLLRHAKSSWDDSRLADFDRPLSPRGQKTAPLIGRALAMHGWHPQMALVSPAARTRETWQLVSAQSHRLMPTPTVRDALYEASAEQLLTETRQTPESVGTLLLLGHNPGLQEFALRLAGEGSDTAALQRLHEKFPTAGLARFEFSGRWDELGFGRARLTHLIRPKDLG